MPLNLIRSDDLNDQTSRPADATPLLARLAAELERLEVRYCQWKGSGKQARWMAGHGDVDLLIDRTSAAAFADATERLGFKLALPAPDRQLPGVVSYLGLDEQLGKLVHVHTHYSLILGRAWTRHYHVAIERAVLDSAASTGGIFRVPAPEYELILFVIQHSLRHELFRREGKIFTELDRLVEQADRTQVGRVLTQHLPAVDPVFFDRCVEALLPGCPGWRRVAVRSQLQRRLSAHVHRPPRATWLRRVAQKIAGKLGLPSRTPSGKRLAGGGAVIALVGADGSGKSTAARTLVKWLGEELRTQRIHLGLPPRSLLTKITGAALKLGRQIDALFGRETTSNLVANLELARFVCTARDRYALYKGVRRFAAGGGIAICERYPVPENYALAGPSQAQGEAGAATGRVAEWLRRRETRYYTRITSPDLLLVLRVEPETAVRRKTDEPAAYVRARARIVRDTDWSGRPVQLIDAEQPFPAVMAELKARIWEAL